MSEPKFRGRLSSIRSLCLVFGNLLSYVIGWAFDWWAGAFLFLVPTTALLLLTLMAHETPSWLLMKNRPLEAMASLEAVRSSDQVAEEWQEMSRKMSCIGETVSYTRLLRPRSFIALLVAFILRIIAGVMSRDSNFAPKFIPFNFFRLADDLF